MSMMKLALEITGILDLVRNDSFSWSSGIAVSTAP